MTITAIEARVGVGLPNFIAVCMQRGWVAGQRPRHTCPCGAAASRKVNKEWVCDECLRKDAVAVELLAEINRANQPEAVIEDEPLSDNPD